MKKRRAKEKPRVFIGSSIEGVPVAEALFACLRHAVDLTLWTYDVFHPGQYPLEALEKQLPRHDFAILVASPDDRIFKGGKMSPAVRDTLLVELGLLAGALGRRRAFFVTPSEPCIEVPSGLAGIILAKYDARRAKLGGDSLAASVQVACQQIRNLVLEEWGVAVSKRNEANARLQRSEKAQAIRRLHTVAIRLRDAVLTVQRDAFAAFSDESTFTSVRAAAAKNVGEIARSFKEDAALLGLGHELDALAEVTKSALLDLPFPRELSTGQGRAQQKAINVGFEAYRTNISGGDRVDHVRDAATGKARGRIDGLKHHYTEWWDRHSDSLYSATIRLQDALFREALELGQTGNIAAEGA